MTVLATGYRPFFLLAGLAGALLVPLWLTTFLGGAVIHPVFPAAGWHGHEMLLGYGGAVLAGFLLTAQPNWTGGPRVSGAPLAALALLWLAGRIVVLFGAQWSPPLVAAIDLAFFPLLALTLAPPLIRAGKLNNLLFLALLALLTAANLGYHLETLGIWDGGGAIGQRLALGTFLFVMTLMAGRVIPAFTRGGVAMKFGGPAPELRVSPRLDLTCLILTGSTALFYTVLPDSGMTGGLALAAAVTNGVRLAGWKGSATLTIPLLWILHMGYAWIVVGLLLMGLSAFLPGLSPTAAVHALGAGALGTLTLGMMSRVALGHGGRPLIPAPATVAAFALILLAGLSRVVWSLFPEYVSTNGLRLSATLWTLSFLLFLIAYGKMLVSKRKDGKPG